MSNFGRANNARRDELNASIDDDAFERDALALGCGQAERVAQLSVRLTAAQDEINALDRAALAAKYAAANALGTLIRPGGRAPSWQIDQKRVDETFASLTTQFN